MSCRLELPEWLDQSVEGRHADLPLAILSALVEAGRTGAPPAQAAVARLAGPERVQNFCDVEIVPVICPTCQMALKSSLSAPPRYFAWGCFRYFGWGAR